MRLVEFVLFIVVGAGIAKNASSESILVQRSVESVIQAKPSSDPLPRTRTLTSTRQAQLGTGIPITTLPPQQGTDVSTTTLQNEAQISSTTLRAPVYIPLKEKEAQTTTPKSSIKESNIRKDTVKKVTEDQVLQKKSPEKENDATELAVRNDEIAENKEGFFSAVNIPFAASIGAAIMFGGLAYYMQSDPEPITSRQGLPPHLGYDHGVRIVRPSDLTPAELDRLVKVGGYHVSGRSITHSAHPYFDYAKKVYKYVMPEILGGSSKEDEAEEKIYIVRHHYHQNNENEKELEKSNAAIEDTESQRKELSTPPTQTQEEHPYNRIVKKSMSKI